MIRFLKDQPNETPIESVSKNCILVSGTPCNRRKQLHSYLYKMLWFTLFANLWDNFREYQE